MPDTMLVLRIDGGKRQFLLLQDSLTNCSTWMSSGTTAPPPHVNCEECTEDGQVFAKSLLRSLLEQTGKCQVSIKNGSLKVTEGVTNCFVFLAQV